MNGPIASPLPFTGDRAERRTRQVAVTLILIWVAMLLRFVDLQIIAVLLEPIRREFSVSDTQLGLLGGTAFALFYGALGIPIAWLADRYNRRTILAVSLGLWSGMTALCGMATSFLSLFAARIGVGVGEAGAIPPGYSLVSDWVPPERRATVFAFLNSTLPLGVLVGFLIGGWVSQYFGWRAAFIAVGIPGLLVAILIRLLVPEPSRRSSGSDRTAEAPSLGTTLRYLWGLPSYRHLVLASSIFTVGAVGSGIWIPSFFVRVHHMSNAEAATWLAFVYSGGGLIGSLAGGVVTDRLVSKTGTARWYALTSAIASAAILPFSFFVYLWGNPIAALLVHTCTTLLMYVWTGPTYATIQTLAGPRRRAMAAAINLLAINVIALAGGPPLVGALSDFFNANFGADALRYSILFLVVLSYSWAAVHFLLASRTLDKDLKAAMST